jgi:hypothetical protein
VKKGWNKRKQTPFFSLWKKARKINGHWNNWIRN